MKTTIGLKLLKITTKNEAESMTDLVCKDLTPHQQNKIFEFCRIYDDKTKDRISIALIKRMKLQQILKIEEKINEKKRIEKYLNAIEFECGGNTAKLARCLNRYLNICPAFKDRYMIYEKNNNK